MPTMNTTELKGRGNVPYQPGPNLPAKGLDHTHDPSACSWVDSANRPDSDFPIQNLPFGICQKTPSQARRLVVAIGDSALDVPAALDRGLLPSLHPIESLLRSDRLNDMISAGSATMRTVRHAVFALLSAEQPARDAVRECLVPRAQVVMELPVQIGDFTDFFTSIHHARRTGELSNPDNPVAPNFLQMPIGYHGRASTVTVSGVPCIRPNGQVGEEPDGSRYQPSGKLDFELEVGCFVSQGTSLGDSIALDSAEMHIGGLCLVNDWSARDIQRWESQPLGPFLGKSFMTSISPWLVTLDALEPFRRPPASRQQGEPEIPPELTSPAHAARGAFSIDLQVLLKTPRMSRRAIEPQVISRARFDDQYWTLFQMLVHQSSNGCRLRTGDLISSGTVSGPDRGESGCLLELTTAGRKPLSLASGETRAYLEDGDTVILRGQCHRPGFRSIGFGECQAEIVCRKAVRSGDPPRSKG